MRILFMFLTAILVVSFNAWSEEPKTEVPHLINMQSLIFDKDGNLTKSEKIDLVIRILDEKNNVLYTETQSQIPVVGGAVNVAIGEQGVTRGIPLEAIDPSTGPKFLDVAVNGTDPFELMPLSSVPYAMIAEKAYKVPDESITTKQIKNESIKPEDLDRSFSFANVAGQVSVTQIPMEISRTADLQNHLNASLGHQASQIGVQQNFITFVASNVQQALEKIDSKLTDEVVNRKGGAVSLSDALKTEVKDRDKAVGDEATARAGVQTNLDNHAKATGGIHGIGIILPDTAGSVIVGTKEAQELTNKTLTSPKITSPTITGTVAGPATYSSPTITTPTINGGTIKGDVTTLLDLRASVGDGKGLAIPEGTTDPKNDSKTTGLLYWDKSTKLLKVSTASGWVTPEIVDGTITNADISGSAEIADTKLATIATAGKVADSALSSKVSLLGSSIESGEITDGTITSVDISTKAGITDEQVSDDVTINLAKAATALAKNGTNCAAGNFSRGVDASGNAEDCTTAATGTVTSVATGSGLTGGTITTSGKIEVDYSTLNGEYVRKDGGTMTGELSVPVPFKSGTAPVKVGAALLSLSDSKVSKSGDTMTGDLGMAAGKKVDGVDVSVHDHSGGEKGVTVRVVPVVLPSEPGKPDCAWSEYIKESADIAYICPSGRVMVGRRHEGDENGGTFYYCCSLKSY